MKLIAHFSYKELAYAIKAISISLGLPERLELLHTLLYNEVYRPQIVEEALCHCVHFFIDHEKSNLLRIGLECCRIIEKQRIVSKTCKLRDILEAYVEWAKTNSIDNSIYRISEEGVDFYKPISSA